MRHCSKCGQDKPHVDFARNAARADGLQVRCRPCQSALANAWNKANRDRTRIIDLRRHEKSRATRIASYRAWLERNPDKKKKYEATHNNRRRAQRMGNGGDHTVEQLKVLFESYMGKCAYCACKATEIDHVVPLSKGGTNDIENLVPACGPCNRRKFNGSLLAFMLRKAAA